MSQYRANAYLASDSVTHHAARRPAFRAAFSAARRCWRFCGALTGAIDGTGALPLACEGMDSNNGRDLGELADVLYERIGRILTEIEEMRGCADAV